jgi:hypothetical protein
MELPYSSLDQLCADRCWVTSLLITLLSDRNSFALVDRFGPSSG